MSSSKVEMYIVKPGDTIDKISYKAYKDEQFWPYIWKYNIDMYLRGRMKMCMLNPRFLFPGQEIGIPPLDKIVRLAPSQELYMSSDYLPFIGVSRLPSLKYFDEKMPWKETIPKKLDHAAAVHAVKNPRIDATKRSAEEEISNTTVNKITSSSYTVNLSGVERTTEPVTNGPYTVTGKYKFNNGSLTIQNKALLNVHTILNPKDKSTSTEIKADCEKAFGKILSSITLSSDKDFTTGKMKIGNFNVSTNKEDPLSISQGTSNSFSISVPEEGKFTCNVKLSLEKPIIAPGFTSITYKGSTTIDYETGDISFPNVLTNSVFGNLFGKNPQYHISLEGVGLEIEFTLSKSDNQHSKSGVPIKNYEFSAFVDDHARKSREYIFFVEKAKLENAGVTRRGITLKKLYMSLYNDFLVNYYILEDAYKSKEKGSLPFSILFLLSREFKMQSDYLFSYKDGSMWTKMIVGIGAPALILVTGGAALIPEAFAAGIGLSTL